MPRDPVISEVRAAREQIARECDYESGKLMERARAIVREWKGQILSRKDLEAIRRHHHRSTG